MRWLSGVVASVCAGTSRTNGQQCGRSGSSVQLPQVVVLSLLIVVAVTCPRSNAALIPFQCPSHQPLLLSCRNGNWTNQSLIAAYATQVAFQGFFTNGLVPATYIPLFLNNFKTVCASVLNFDICSSQGPASICNVQAADVKYIPCTQAMHFQIKSGETIAGNASSTTTQLQYIMELLEPLRIRSTLLALHIENIGTSLDISEVDVVFDKMTSATKLETLSLQGFDFPFFDLSSVLQRLSFVRNMSFAGNSIQVLNVTDGGGSDDDDDDNGNRNSRSLRKIDLSNNSLTQVPNGLFAEIPNVLMIDLSDNQIAEVKEEFLNGAQTGTGKIEISLASNNMSWVNFLPLFARTDGGLDTYGRTPVFRLEGNPWRCDCNSWTLRWLLDARDQTAGRTVLCTDRGNEPLMNFTFEDLCPSKVIMERNNRKSPDPISHGLVFIVENKLTVRFVCRSETFSRSWADVACYSRGLLGAREKAYMPSIIRTSIYSDNLNSVTANCGLSAASISQCQFTTGVCFPRVSVYCSESCEPPAPPPERTLPATEVGIASQAGQLVSWEPLKTKDWGRPPGHYVVEYRSLSDNDPLTYMTAVEPGATSAYLPRALPGRDYQVWVTPVTGRALIRSPRVLPTTVAFPSQTPGRVQSLEVVEVASSGASVFHVTWNALQAEEWNGLPGYYQVELGRARHHNRLQHMLLDSQVVERTSPLAVSISLGNFSINPNHTDHDLFQIAVRAVNFDNNQTSMSGNWSLKHVWSKPIGKVRDNGTEVLKNAFGLRIQWLHYPRARHDPDFRYRIETCRALNCSSVYLNDSSSELEHIVTATDSVFFDVTSVSVRACGGEDLSLCGPAETFRWRCINETVPFTKNLTLLPPSSSGSYSYEAVIDTSFWDASSVLAAEASMAVRILYSSVGNRQSVSDLGSERFALLANDSSELVLTSREGWLRLNAMHNFSFVQFISDTEYNETGMAQIECQATSRQTANVAPKPPAVKRVESRDVHSADVSLLLPRLTSPGEYYQVMAVPVGSGEVHRQQFGRLSRRGRRQASNGSDDTEDRILTGLAANTTYEVWVQSCVLLSSPATASESCGAWSDKFVALTGASNPTNVSNVTTPAPVTTSDDTVTATAPSSSDTIIIIVIAAAVCGVVILLAIIFVVISIRKSQGHKIRPYKEKPLHGAGQNDLGPMTPVILYPSDQEIPDDDLVLGEVLGHGEFGSVQKATYKPNGGQEMVTAVKVLKPTATAEGEEFKALSNEIDLMAAIAKKGKHINVIKMVAGGKYRHKPCMVLEFMDMGDLHSYLARHRLGQGHRSMLHPVLCTRLTSKELVSLAVQVARGMVFLARIHVIHRDLAARNILLQSNGPETMTLKVADFGLARTVNNDGNYQYKRMMGKRIPLKWLAIESLRSDAYTSASDVWSFGVLLWEIVTLGGHPYPGIPLGWKDLIAYLECGGRMARPKYCSSEIYAVMHDCWKSAPEERPTFQQLVERLESMLADNSDYITVDSSEVALESDIVDTVDSDSDSEYTGWPKGVHPYAESSGMYTPDGYLAPRDNFTHFRMPSVGKDKEAADATGATDVNGDDNDNDELSRRAERQGSWRSSRRQSSIKSNRVLSMLRTVGQSLNIPFKSKSTESLDRPNQAEESIDTKSSEHRSVGRRHSSSELPSEESTVVARAFRRRTSSESHREPSSGGGLTVPLNRSVSNQSGKTNVVSRSRWPKSLQTQRQSKEYGSNTQPEVFQPPSSEQRATGSDLYSSSHLSAPPAMSVSAPHTAAPIHEANPPSGNPRVAPKPAAGADARESPKPALPPRNNGVLKGSPVSGARKRPPNLNTALPRHMQPSPFTSSESISTLGQVELEDGVFGSGSESTSVTDGQENGSVSKAAYDALVGSRTSRIGKSKTGVHIPTAGVSHV